MFSSRSLCHLWRPAGRGGPAPSLGRFSPSELSAEAASFSKIHLNLGWPWKLGWLGRGQSRGLPPGLAVGSHTGPESQAGLGELRPSLAARGEDRRAGRQACGGSPEAGWVLWAALPRC